MPTQDYLSGQRVGSRALSLVPCLLILEAPYGFTAPAADNIQLEYNASSEAHRHLTPYRSLLAPIAIRTHCVPN